MNKTLSRNNHIFSKTMEWHRGVQSYIIHLLSKPIGFNVIFRSVIAYKMISYLENLVAFIVVQALQQDKIKAFGQFRLVSNINFWYCNAAYPTYVYQFSTNINISSIYHEHTCTNYSQVYSYVFQMQRIQFM